MRLLKLGSFGADVLKWEIFLRGQGFPIVANAEFDKLTMELTKKFQARSKLKPDGIVGAESWGVALSKGLSGVIDEDGGGDEDGDNYPLPPTDVTPYFANAERIRDFGRFEYKASPTDTNPEAILVLDDFVKRNIVAVKPINSNITLHVHKFVKDDLKSMFAHLLREKLMHKIISWNGSYNARFKRGSRDDLSSHSWGTAFDINSNNNKLGTVPALKNEKGCVRDLVGIANEHGFYWGGHFNRRRDGMHFEYARPK